MVKEPFHSESTNEIIEKILERAAVELGIETTKGNQGMARSSTTLSNVVISNTSGITANILFQPGLGLTQSQIDQIQATFSALGVQMTGRALRTNLLELRL